MSHPRADTLAAFEPVVLVGDLADMAELEEEGFPDGLLREKGVRPGSEDRPRRQREQRGPRVLGEGTLEKFCRMENR